MCWGGCIPRAIDFASRYCDGKNILASAIPGAGQTTAGDESNSMIVANPLSCYCSHLPLELDDNHSSASSVMAVDSLKEGA